MTNTIVYTALQDLVDLLKTCTVSNLPLVQPIYDEKSVGLGADQQESIFVQADGEKIDYYLHADDTFHTGQLSIDIWTRTDLTRLNTLVSGVFNTIKTNARFSQNGNTYSDLLVVDQHPLSDQYRNLFRHKIDVTIRKVNP